MVDECAAPRPAGHQGPARPRHHRLLLGCALRRSEVAALTDGRSSGGFTPEATVAAPHADTAEASRYLITTTVPAGATTGKVEVLTPSRTLSSIVRSFGSGRQARSDLRIPRARKSLFDGLPNARAEMDRGRAHRRVLNDSFHAGSKLHWRAADRAPGPQLIQKAPLLRDRSTRLN